MIGIDNRFEHQPWNRLAEGFKNRHVQINQLKSRFRMQLFVAFDLLLALSNACVFFDRRSLPIAHRVLHIERVRRL